jgi:hypothetical protein
LTVSKLIQYKAESGQVTEGRISLEQEGWHSYPNDSSNSLI